MPPGTTSRDAALRQHLLNLLQGRGAHLDLNAALEAWPPGARGAVPEGLPYSPWQLLEHLRLAQADILDFCTNPGYEQPDWPEDYWPEDAAPPVPEAWDESAAQLRRDLQAMQDLVANPATDLFAEIPHGDGQTLLREALLVADHNAYHLGQLVMARRLLGAWPPDEA